MIEEIGRTIKERHKKELWEYFDLIVGTSTGGILAGAIGLGVPYEKLVSIYFDDSKNIFKDRSFGALYNQNDLKDVIKNCLRENNIFGDHVPLMSEAKTRIAVTAYECQTARNVLLTNEKPKGTVDFKTEDYIPAGNFSAIKCIRATSSAPTYFEAAVINEGAIQSPVLRKKGKVHIYSDGGCTMNNPTVRAYDYTDKLIRDGMFDSKKSETENESKVVMISLGTGEADLGEYERNTGTLGFVRNGGLDHLTEGAQRCSAKAAEKILGLMKNVVYIDSILP